jgi:hypothetical protein
MPPGISAHAATQRGVTDVTAMRWLPCAVTSHDDTDDISGGRRGAAIGRPVLNARRDKMTGTLEQVSGLLHEAGETHHQVFRIVDGADDDWASWYAQWLIDLSELPDLLGVRPVRSELIYLLVSLDRQFTAEAPGEPWETYYARQILRHFQPSGG